MKKIILMIALISSLYSQNIDLNLKQFAELVSSQHLINIIIDDTIEEKKFTFFVQRNKDIILLGAFKKMLELKKLNLIYDKKYNFYYIKPIKKPKPKKKPEKHIYTIKLKTLVYKDIELILSQFENLKFSYLKNSNSVLIYTTSKEFKELENVIKNNDFVLEQFQLKISVIETNVNEVKERGIKINAYSQKLTGENQHFINLITMPSTASTNVFSGATSAYTASLQFLDDLGVSKIESSPFVTVQSGKKVYFSSVENIPYQIGNSVVNGASQTEQTQTTYKDVGLKISLIPTILNEVIFIDLDFVIETIIGERSATPSTSKRELKNSFQLRKNQLLVLSGLENSIVSTSTIGIPILMEIPYLGQMFRFDINTEIKKSLSILIEVI